VSKKSAARIFRGSITGIDNTAEKRLRMHQIMKIWREFEYQFLKQKHAY
jgi:hypothetical protein